MLPLGDRTEVLDPARALDPALVLTSWLAETAAGGEDLHPRLLRCADGRLVPLPVARWAGAPDPVDLQLLERARGPVLDVGCGPGRLTAALHRRGVEVLGVEPVAALPVLARAAGAAVLRADVFAEVPGAGGWRTVLVIDGNIGIGGDLVRLLRRMAGLLAPDGELVVELHPGPELPAGPVRLEGLGVTSAWFSWTLVGSQMLSAAAAATGLTVHEQWTGDGRSFAALRHDT